MFEAKLKSRSQPKLGALAVTFPIPEERYENVILALQNLQIGDVRKQDCCIESIRAPDCPALLRMTNTMANVDELDWLGKQLESFDRYELLQFNAAVERFGLSAADELIDLSFCARGVTVVSDFNDLELVGKRHYTDVHRGLGHGLGQNVTSKIWLNFLTAKCKKKLRNQAISELFMVDSTGLEPVTPCTSRAIRSCFTVF